MSIASGTRIGPYEVIAPLGAGGMGEVFRARDSRLGRIVALKTLPPAFAREPERLERFEREARAAGSLQHPGIVTLFDVGTHEGRPYFVSELVDGESLRDLLQKGPVRPERAVEIAIALADALGAAHASGIVHRDLKPENVVFTRDGRPKLLDFGLAKLVQREPTLSEETSARTLDGTLLGTAAYMAPEQARGEPADHRVDLFALGCVMLEMLSGKSPFHRPNPLETLAALLKDEAPPLPAEVRAAWPGLSGLIMRCLEKRPEQRFDSARDLACALESLRQAVQASIPATAAPVVRTTAAEINFRRLTYRRGTVHSARFTPDGHGVVYAAAWEGQHHELFWVFGGATESRPLGIRDATLLGISRSSELAIGRTYRSRGAFIFDGMLARVSLGAGTPRDIQAEVQFADWSPDGTQLAAVTEVGGSMQIEYPLGHQVFRSDGGWISEPRVSRDGQHVAFLDHPIRGDDGGWVAVVDREGSVRRLSHMPGTLRGLSWSPDGSEIWFTGAPSGIGRALRAVSLEGETRVLLQIAGALLLHDVAPDGRVLLSHGDERLGMQFGSFEPREERDLSWFDWSLLRDMSRDGSMVLFDESGEGGGALPSAYLRGTDGSPATRLADALGMGISPDEKWVLAIKTMQKGSVLLVPVGAGSPRTIELTEFDIHLAGWLGDGRSFWMTASRPGESIRTHRVSLEDGSIRPITPPGVGAFESRATPDGRYLLAPGTDQVHQLFPVEGGDPLPLPGMIRGDRPIGWPGDGSRLFVFERGSMPAHVHTIDMRTGERTFWRDIGPSDPSGVFSVAPVRLSHDTNRYAYSYGRTLTDLFEVRGLS